MPGGKTAVFRRLAALAAVLVLALILAACGTGPVRRTDTGSTASSPPSGKSYVINGQRYYILASAHGYAEEGEASWYGGKFHGRKTASGERYNMYDYTAAHKTLPLGTWVKVTNLANHRDVTLRVNDRGPFVRGRIIDLSYTGARELGMTDAGTAPVRVEALGTPEKRTVDGEVTTVLVQPTDYSRGDFAVQVGSFQDKDNARRLAVQMKQQYGAASIQTFDRGDAVFYRVHVGRPRTLSQAAELQDKLESRGFEDCFVVAR